MAKANKLPWKMDFIRQSAAFSRLDYIQRFAAADSWPSLTELQNSLDSRHKELKSGFAQKIRFVAQSTKPQVFEDEYEVRIYQKGEIQTRKDNWHDFFHALIWMNFPMTKVKLNTLHYRAMLNRVSRGENFRSTMENKLTHFDECGAIILAKDDCLLELIRQAQWKELFCRHKADWGKELECIVFGHALYEKLLCPYEGLCAHAVLFEVDEINQPVPLVDRYLSSRIKNKLKSPLYPFPLLGVPGWYNGQNEVFYNNKRYFRDRVKTARVSI